MKKMILGSALLLTNLWAESISILPYGGHLNYSSDSTKSFKNNGTVYGTYMSIGNLKYLLEADYAHINLKYKDATSTDLKQDDITVAYSAYNDKYMFKLGYHNIATTDEELGDGNVIIGSIGGYQFVGYDKYSYGVDEYYSRFNNGQDEDGARKAIKIIQTTPYFSFYKSINADFGNTVVVKGNYQKANDYVDNSYISYEASDTIFYKKFFTTFKAYGGEMRTGTKDGGFTVYNTLDLMKTGYGIKLGLNINKSTLMSLGYDINNYREYGKTVDGSNSVAIASLSYRY